MKYVIYSQNVDLDKVMIFDEFHNHSDVLNWLNLKKENIISAGNCFADNLNGIGVSKHGSFTLKIEINNERWLKDEELLKRRFE